MKNNIHEKHFSTIFISLMLVLHFTFGFTPLCFGFTFDLRKSHLFYTLVGTYQNTSIFHKQIQKYPTMLGPLMLYHKKDEVHVKVLCDISIEKCSGLKKSVRDTRRVILCFTEFSTKIH